MNCANPTRLIAGLLLVLTFAPLCASSAASPGELTTIAERSAFTRTGRYDEVERLCTALAARWPDKARCFEFGRSPENRPLLAIAVSDDGVLDPESVRARQRPVVLFQGGIHAGEIDGKDAGFVALRELLEGRENRGALARATVLFVPVFNVDGHERFGAWNRPNQRGPEQMGWRATAQNLNLNRDYTKADAPEMRALLGLLNAWDPILYTDLHVTDGAELREDLSVEVEPGHGWDLELGHTGHALRDEVLARLQRKGLHAPPFYPEFVPADDPTAIVVEDQGQHAVERGAEGQLPDANAGLVVPDRLGLVALAVVREGLLELVLRAHIRKMPKAGSGRGALAAALRDSPRTVLVSAGSITPSSHSRALA